MSLGSILLQGLAIFVGLNMSLGIMRWLGIKYAGFLQRVIIAYINLLACAFFGVVSSIFLTLSGRKRLAQWVTATAFYYTMPYSTGMNFEVISGAEHLNAARPAVLVGNHQSALDILMLATVWPRYCSVTAKKQLKHMPFLGWFMSLSGTVFLDRANKASAMKAFESAASEMQKHKQSVFVFPEGTRSGTTEPMMLPFKKGAFHLAVQAKVPILPVVTCVYSGVFSSANWRFRSGRVPIIVLPPIPTDNLDPSDVDELTRFTRDKMIETLKRLSNSARGQSAMLENPPPTVKEPRSTAKPRDAPQGQQSAEGGAQGTGSTSAQTDPGNARQR